MHARRELLMWGGPRCSSLNILSARDVGSKLRPKRLSHTPVERIYRDDSHRFQETLIAGRDRTTRPLREATARRNPSPAAAIMIALAINSSFIPRDAFSSTRSPSPTMVPA
jgi:hypothetical protein